MSAFTGVGACSSEYVVPFHQKGTIDELIAQCFKSYCCCKLVDSGFRVNKIAATNMIQLIEQLFRVWLHSNEMQLFFRSTSKWESRCIKAVIAAKVRH